MRLWCHLLSQQRIRIDVSALPVTLRIGQDRNRKMEMKISRARITGVANVSDDFPLFQEFPDCETFGVTLQMGVIINELSVTAELINSCAAAFALKKFYDFAVGRSQNWSPGRSGNINGIMDPSL